MPEHRHLPMRSSQRLLPRLFQRLLAGLCLGLAGAWLPAAGADAPPPSPGAGARADAAEGQRYTVTYVVDGDSLWVQPVGGGRRLKLRLSGIDAPEICQPAGPQARQTLQALVLHQTVRVHIRAHDRYGRAIAEVQREHDGLMLAAHLVAQGWAWSESANGRWRGAYWREQRQAQAAARGLFAQPGAEHPAQFRRRHGPCGAQP